MKAPNFSLPDASGTYHKLEDYYGKWTILYFYPQDDTPGCTTEACAFRDAIQVFHSVKVQVLGISKDSPASHKAFADKYQLPFPLLSDTSTNVIKAYGAWGKKTFNGKEYEGTLRNTYLINPGGTIVKSYENVDPLLHVTELLKDLRSFQ